MTGRSELGRTALRGRLSDGSGREDRRLLDRLGDELDRDPAAITRSIALPVSYDQPSITRDAINEAIDAGFTHHILMLPTPYPLDVAHWTADQHITPTAAR